ncbi:MAG: hypothetical protein ACREDF_09690 [Thermoplasmata archaeon]
MANPAAVDQVSLTREVLAATKELIVQVKTMTRAMLDATEATDALREELKTLGEAISKADVSFDAAEDPLPPEG